MLLIRFLRFFLFFLMIFFPEFISKIIFLRENKNEIRDPVLMHKMWDKQ